MEMPQTPPPTIFEKKTVVDKCMIDKPLELAFEAHDTAPVALAEYKNLVACRVMLDMLMFCKNADGNIERSVLRAAEKLRELYA